MKGKSSAHQARPRNGTQISSLLRKKRRNGMRRFKHGLQHDDVDPALVVGQHQVMAVVSQAFEADRRDPGRSEVPHQPRVEGDPALGQAHQRRSQQAPGRVHRQQPLQEGDQEQGQGMDDRAQRDQADHQRSTDDPGYPVEHARHPALRKAVIFHHLGPESKPGGPGNLHATWQRSKSDFQPGAPRMTRSTRLALLAALVFCAPALAASGPLTTVAERSGFKQTGRFDEVISLCADFERSYPGAVRCTRFGTTPEGRPMLALVASRSGALDPAEARKRGLPVLLIQGGIHAGEIDGKDAGFLALRQALDGKAAKGALDRQVLVFVPVFNVDGHERFGRWNRPNQRGPEQMGWRTTGQNLNLNRDYLKADAPEMQAMLALVEQWDPIAYIDLHVTDGAKFEHDVSIQVEPVHAGDDALRVAGTAAARRRDGGPGTAGLPATVLLSLVQGQRRPEFGLRGRRLPAAVFDRLLPAAQPFRDAGRDAFLEGLPDPRAHHPQHDRFVAGADRRTRRRLAGAGARRRRAQRRVGRDSRWRWSTRLRETARTIEFRGYEYTRTPSEVSGALMTRYDETRPQVWRVPMRDDVQPTLTVAAPRGGYLVPAAQAAWVGEKLRQHGVSFRVLERALPAQSVEVFRATSVQFGATSVEGHLRADGEG